jgi:hypothetical protein
VLVVVDLAALQHGIAARGILTNRLRAIGMVELDVMQALAPPLQMFVIDAVAGQRLDQLELRIAAPGDRDQARMRRRLAAIGVVFDLAGLELIDIPRPDLARLPVALHRGLEIAHDHRDLNGRALLKLSHSLLPWSGRFFPSAVEGA